MEKELHHWRWVKQNRRTRDRAESVHAPAARALERASAAVPRQWAGVAEALADVLGPDLQGQLSVHALQRGILTLRVRDRRYLHTARITWALDILERIQSTCADCNVRRIRFITAPQTRRPIRGNTQTRNT